jgi:ABC-2 type transport system permease protein
VKAVAIARASIRRLLRDRTALFFIVVLPIVIIVIIGAVVRGFNTFRVGVLELGSTSAGRALAADLQHTPGLTVARYSTTAALDKAVARVASVIDSYGGRVQAAAFSTRFGPSFESAFARAEVLAKSVPQVSLVTRVITATQQTLPSGYEYSAPTELVLFVFLSAIAGGATIVESRRLGMFERMSVAPVRRRTIIVGESLTYVGVALVQSLIIVGIGAMFGVWWGNPVAAGVLIVLWCFVGASAGMVAGTLFRTPEQASAIGPVVGITFAMLGGCMWPLSIVSTGMREFGHVTPQAWAVDAWTKLLAGHADVVAIGPQLGVLALFALAFFSVAIVRLRSALTAQSA